jgi:hypothetical protein
MICQTDCRLTKYLFNVQVAARLELSKWKMLRSYPQPMHNLCNTPMNKREDCTTLDTPIHSARSQRAATRVSSQRRAKCLGKLFALTALAVGTTYQTTNANQVHWINDSMNLKLYAHNQIDQWNEFECFVELIQRESSWRYWVRNGSHTGLGQMRSDWYGKQSPRKQIDLTLKYITKRYSGRICDGALAHQKNFGWY